MDEVFGSGEFLKTNGLGGVRLDEKRLTVSGHSFGGITAITSAMSD